MHHARRPRAKKAKPDPREKQLAALIRKRDNSNLSEYNVLDKRIEAVAGVLGRFCLFQVSCLRFCLR